MTVKHSLWKVGAAPVQLPPSSLPSEQMLEEMIVAAPNLLHDQWMLIGRQRDTGFGGRIDLLAIAPDGSLILIELKRDRTPREVVAQAIDYATFVERLTFQELTAVYSAFIPGHDLGADFRLRFGHDLADDELNQSHQIVIVAAEIDDSTHRIVSYLNERDIAINVLCFQVFQDGASQFLSRVWLLDPAQTQEHAAVATEQAREPWNGEFYASYGHSSERSWEEARKYGFICAGGGSWYSNTLNLLEIGDRVWVKAPGFGFVGVGRVESKPISAANFTVITDVGEQPALQALSKANYHREFADDPERSEYFVRIRWLDTVPLDGALQEPGFFGNQNTVCRPLTPKWRNTVERLKALFKHVF